jgi:hypothetical protein
VVDLKKQKAINRIVRDLKRDIKTMESLQWKVQWLNSRDSNCGNAASLTDAIEVLIEKALSFHRKELKEFEADFLKSEEATR